MVQRRSSPGALAWRHVNPPQEWAAQHQLEAILELSTLVVAVRARTGGRCYVPDCSNPICMYPHAMSAWDGGVHHPVNRLGVCHDHSDELRIPANGFALRRVLQSQLMGWYIRQGIRGLAWAHMSMGRRPIPNDLPAVGPATWEVTPLAGASS